MPESPQSRTGWKARLAHAFAVEKPEDIDPTPQQREIVDRLCAEVVRRRMGLPALMALKMSQPLNRVAGSALHVMQPVMSAVLSPEAITQFALFLEHAGSIDYLCRRIEHFQGRCQESGDRCQGPRDDTPSATAENPDT